MSNINLLVTYFSAFTFSDYTLNCDYFPCLKTNLRYKK